MTVQKSKVEILHEEITELSSGGMQRLYEIDGICHTAHQILNSFTITDREELIKKLPDWNNIRLEFLAFILQDDNSGDSEAYDDNFLLGYIFTLADDSLASNLLNQSLIFFFEENTIDSMELLDSMLNRLEGLKLNSYIDGPTFKYWVECITNSKTKL